MTVDIKTAVGILLMKASSDPIATKVITAFNSCSSKTSNIRALSGFKVEMLERCAEFLCIDLEGSDGMKIFTKDTLITRILMTIESFLPSECSECNHQYCNELDPQEAPLFHCFMCYQGSHDCQAIRDKKKLMSDSGIELPAGSVWLCSACHKSSDPYKPRKSKSRHDSVTAKGTISGTSTPASEIVKPGGLSPSQKSKLADKLHKVAKENVCPDYSRGKSPMAIEVIS